MSVTFVKHEGSRLHFLDRCYELYRIYPGGKEWFCGYFRSKEDYDIELARCKNEEAGPDEYVIKEIPSKGIPLYPDSEQKFVKATEFAKTIKPRRRKQ